MTGHEQIVALRESGYKPAAAFVFDTPEPAIGAGWELPVGGLPAVYVGNDSPERTDMRFLVGCRVHLVAPNPSRAVGWVDRLMRDGVPHIVQSTEGEVYQWRA